MLVDLIHLKNLKTCLCIFKYKPEIGPKTVRCVLYMSQKKEGGGGWEQDSHVVFQDTATKENTPSIKIQVKLSVQISPLSA